MGGELNVIHRCAGAAGVLVGLLLGVSALFEVFFDEDRVTCWFQGIACGWVPLVVVGVYLSIQGGALSRRARRWATVAFVVHLVGATYFAGHGFMDNFVTAHMPPEVFDEYVFGAYRATFATIGVAFAVTAVWFAVVMARSGTIPLLVAGAYAVMMPVLVVSGPMPGTSDVKAVVHAVTGAVIAAVGIVVWRTAISGSNRPDRRSGIEHSPAPSYY